MLPFISQSNKRYLYDVILKLNIQSLFLFINYYDLFNSFSIKFKNIKFNDDYFCDDRDLHVKSYEHLLQKLNQLHVRDGARR
jgi:hypothetical protein